MSTRFQRKLALSALLGVLLAPASGENHALSVSPRRLVEVTDLSTPRVSPDGAHVVYRAEKASIDRATYDSVWYVQRMDGSAPPVKVGEGGVPLRDSAGGSLPAAALWSPDGRFVFFKALLESRVDVWRAAADGSGAEAITRDAADVREFSVSADGRTLRYSVGATRDEVARAEQDEYDSGIRVDGTVPVGAGLFRSSFVEGRLATQRYTGLWFTRGSLLGAQPSRWQEIDLDTRERRDDPQMDAASRRAAEPVDASALPTVLLEAIDPTSGRIAVLTRADGGDRTRRSDRSELALLPWKGAVAVKCEADACSGRAISSVQWRPRRQELVFTVTDREAGEAQSLFRWNVLNGSVTQVVAGRGFVNGGRDRASLCGISQDALACVVAEADLPPRLERVDIETGQRAVLFEPNAALASDLQAAVSSRLVQWTDQNGRTLSGQLFERRGEVGAPHPLFVNYYRCMGFLRGGMGDEWPLASLAEAGISTLCLNAPALNADPVLRFDGAVDAVRSAVDILAGEGRIDPDRVGMGGLSFGSEVAMWVAMQSDLLAAVSVTSPSVTPLYHLMGSAKGPDFEKGLRAVWGLGLPRETPEQWQRLSPTYNLERIGVPVLFQMPEEEYLYALDYAIPLMRDLRAEIYVFPHEPHRKFQPRHMLAAYERNFDWFRFWLQHEEDSDPRKVPQYVRWREMRERAAGDDDDGR